METVPVDQVERWNAMERRYPWWYIDWHHGQWRAIREGSDSPVVFIESQLRAVLDRVEHAEGKR